MQYHAYELAHAILSPARYAAKGMRMGLQSPFNLFGMTPWGRSMAAGCKVFERMTQRYDKPEFGLPSTRINGVEVAIHEEIVDRKPFCNLLRFRRDANAVDTSNDPKVLIIAPMSGHYATLLRGTVEAMLPDHDTYITDWTDARDVAVGDGNFDLNSFIDYIIEFAQFLGPNTHAIAVCQPAVPGLAAAAVLAEQDDPAQFASLTLMGGPIDTRRNPTAVNKLAEQKPIDWFERNVISSVPFPHIGMMRRVYPGFVQLTGFMTMNLDRHAEAHMELFNNLVKGDCDSVSQHTTFYDEYLAVMDLPAEFYLQTVEEVFQAHTLPDGRMRHNNRPVNCAAIKNTALMTVEGEKDDICGLGQTRAAHDLTPNIPEDEKYHYEQPGVGHYGIFNGRRWRTEIQPRIREMIQAVEYRRRSGGQSGRDNKVVPLRKPDAAE